MASAPLRWWTPRPLSLKLYARWPTDPAKLPPYRPQLALLVKSPPEGDEWLHELKLDGYRIGVAIDRRRRDAPEPARKGVDGRIPAVVAGAKKLPVTAALIDGELAGVLPDGRTSMHAMGGAYRLVFFAFDIIHLDGEDLTALPLLERKAAAARARWARSRRRRFVRRPRRRRRRRVLSRRRAR